MKNSQNKFKFLGTNDFEINNNIKNNSTWPM